MGPPGSGIATTEYSYLADGTRLGVAQNKGTNSSPTYYGYLNAGSLNVLHNGASVVFESSAFEAGVIYSHGLMYFTRDHLGNTRVVTDGSGNVVERDDYYPFGERHSDSSMPTVSSNRWRFAGKEIQPLGGTGWLDFGARQYDSFLGRWTTVDPLAEKYPGISPYSYCVGDPINRYDPNGKTDYFCYSGTMLYRDVYDNGEIRVIEATDFQRLISQCDNKCSRVMDVTFQESLFATSKTFTQGLRSGDLSDDAAKAIINHYCDNNVELGELKKLNKNGKRGSFGASYNGPIVADLDVIKSDGRQVHMQGDVVVSETYLYDNAYNIKSSVDDHEAFHQSDPIQDDNRELRAYGNQITSPGFSKTTGYFQSIMKQRYEKIK